jgi:hypothetical protein
MTLLDLSLHIAPLAGAFFGLRSELTFKRFFISISGTSFKVSFEVPN